MNLYHKMLRYGAIWLVSLFFQFWSFFFWAKQPPMVCFNHDHGEILQLETLRAANELQEMTPWFSTTKWLVMALFGWFCSPLPILVLFTLLFSSDLPLADRIWALISPKEASTDFVREQKIRRSEPRNCLSIISIRVALQPPIMLW